MWLKTDSRQGAHASYYYIGNIDHVHIVEAKRYSFKKKADLLRYEVLFYGDGVFFETKAEAEKFLKNLMIAVRFANSGRLNTIVPPYIVTVDEIKNMEWEL